MPADGEIIVVTLIQQTISIFGLIFNLAIVLITIKNKNLQNSYGYLLAIYSFLESLVESATFLPTILTLINTKIPLLTCFYVSVFQTIFASQNAIFSLFFISIDRLLAIIFPIFYSFILKRGAGKFVFGMVLSCGYILIIVYYDWLYVLQNLETTVYCNPGDQFGGSILQWCLYNVMTLSIIIVLIYISLGIYIKFSRTEDSHMALNRRIYKTLAIVMCVIFFFYFMSCFGVEFILPLLTNDPQMAFFYCRLFAQANTLGGAINAPVLYVCSTEYRITMNRQFPFILKMLKVCHVMPMNNNKNSQIALPLATTIQPAANNMAKIHPMVN